MDIFDVTGGGPLQGEVRVTGAKNSVLKLMAVALLAPGRTVIEEVPAILDVSIMGELIERLGCGVEHDLEAGTVTIDVPEKLQHRADYDLVRRMRASISVLGPLLARCSAADVALPGGDAIGSRGLDMHIAGLERMGVEVTSAHGFLMATAPNGLTGATVWLDFPSVGATETLLMAAVTAEGVTTIENAAREPEIIDICTMLSEMGAQIEGAGYSTLVITGVPGLSPVRHRTLSDRIVTGTWAVAAAMTQGDVLIRNCQAQHLEIALDKLSTAGADVSTTEDTIHVRMNGQPKAVDIVTLPYPGFPTDLQPQFIAMNAVSEGAAMVTENLFEARFKFVNELVRLGADIKIEGHHAIVRGKPRLSGAPVEATDIRAGASLVLGGLAADGFTSVHNVEHIDRGYPNFVDDLRNLGAVIERRTV